MNENIFYVFNSFAGQNYVVDQLIIFLSNWFGYLLIALLGIFLIFHKDKKKGVRDLFVVLTAAITAYALAKIFKEIFPNPRPFEVLTDANILYEHGGGDSFPSGHATFFAALATAIYFYHKKIALWYAIGALLIGLSRIVVGIHWPLDILVGYILGGIIGTAVYFSYKTYFLGRQLQNSSKSVE